jgi:hypothetical protein
MRVQPRVEALEDRAVLSWAGVPPTAITPPLTAVQITLDSQGDATGGAVIENNEDDYYSFVAHGTGTYQLTARAANSTIDTVLGVFDAAGQRLAHNDDVTPGADRNSQVSLTLQAGSRYYVGITNYTGEAGGGYTWGVDGPARAGDDAFEENDSMNAAANLGVLTVRRTVTGLVMGDAQDWFRFNMTGAGTPGNDLAIQFQHAQGDLELRLYNGGGLLLRRSEGAGNEERISLDGLAAGGYYVQVFGYEGARNPDYTLDINPAVGNGDDSFEENDAFTAAANLGTLTARRTVTGLVMGDSQDWFRFTMPGAGAAANYLAVQFQHAQGDLDVRLYDAAGTLVRASDSPTNEERVSLDGLAAGTYYVQVYGYDGARNPNYTLDVNPGTGGGATGNRVLYMNFDGATITRADLVRWAGGDWAGSFGYLDPQGDGIRVQPFLAARGDREQVIGRIMTMVQDDLRPFGITVQRRTGLAVENQGATTLFFGPNGLSNQHVACDIDYGNNNRTDIAFIGDENVWGTAERMGVALADVALHEAGHTFGLHHVNTHQDGLIYFESMGWRYTQGDQSRWVQDTTFQDRTFVAYVDQNGFPHGPGPQNTYQTMRRNFGVTGSPAPGGAPGPWDNPSAELVALVDTSTPGVFAVSTGSGTDTITVQQLPSGALEVTVNGSAYEIGPGLREIRIHSPGGRDQVQLLSLLGDVRLSVFTEDQDAPTPDAKIDLAAAALWNGSQLQMALSDLGEGCGCAECRMAVRQAGTVTAAREDRAVSRPGATAAAAIWLGVEDVPPGAVETVSATRRDGPASEPVAEAVPAAPHSRSVLTAVPGARRVAVGNPDLGNKGSANDWGLPGLPGTLEMIAL